LRARVRDTVRRPTAKREPSVVLRGSVLQAASPSAASMAAGVEAAPAPPRRSVAGPSPPCKGGVWGGCRRGTRRPAQGSPPQRRPDYSERHCSTLEKRSSLRPEATHLLLRRGVIPHAGRRQSRPRALPA